MIFLMENATFSLEFDYFNEPYKDKDLDSIRKLNTNNQLRLCNLKMKYSNSDFIYPINYLYEFIELSYEINELIDKNYHLTRKLNEVHYLYKPIVAK